MTITSINTDTFLADLINFIRDKIEADSTVVDPESSNRAGNERFVMTSYPNRPARYPYITVVDSNSRFKSLGMRSTQMQGNISIEIRAWALTVAHRDELAQQIVNHFRKDQFANSEYSDTAGFHDFEVLSMVNVDSPGEQGTKSKVIMIGGLIIIGG